MVLEFVTPSSDLWELTKKYAAACSWSAGKALARAMTANAFAGWERVIVAHENGAICGYCAVVQKDCIAGLPYTPYISYVFVGEEHRGKRLSQKLITFATEYLKKQGFHAVYLISDHENLYEKYGFTVIDRALAPWGAMEKIYRMAI